MCENKRLSECSTEELRTELIKRLRSEGGDDDFSDDGGEEPTTLYFDSDCSLLSFPIRQTTESQILDSIGDMLSRTPSDSWVLEADPNEELHDRNSSDPNHVLLVHKSIQAMKEAPLNWNHINSLSLKGLNLSGSDAINHLLGNTIALSSLTFDNCAMANLPPYEHLAMYFDTQGIQVLETLVFNNAYMGDRFYENYQVAELLLEAASAFPNLERLVLNIRSIQEYSYLHGNITDSVRSLLGNCNQLYSFETNCRIDIEDLSDMLVDNSSLQELEMGAEDSPEPLKPLADTLEKNITMLCSLRLKSRNGTVLPLQTYEDGGRLLYLTLLNRHGRETLLGNDVSLLILVQNLCDVHGDDDPLLEDSASMTLSVFFGLLSLVEPTIWPPSAIGYFTGLAKNEAKTK